MKKIALGLLMLFTAGMVCSCAGSKKQVSGGCNAQKPNNHKASRTFLY